MEENIKESFKRIEVIADNEVSEFNKTLIEGNINQIKRYIENLIQENKELKEENWIMRIVDKQYINKNKIKEKIEEMKRYRDYRPVINKFTYSEIIDYEIKILQELLEKGE